MSVVRIDHVSKDFQLGEQTVHALHDITLAVEPGVFLAISGPSGSGKTTLLNLIGCIDKPTSGNIYINEQDVSSRTANELGRFALPLDWLHFSDLQPAPSPISRRKC
jgi:putative ABC transport system ATP-binding protein